LETNEFLDKIFLKGDKILVFTQKYIQEEKAVYLLLREYETLSGNLIGGIKQITISHPTDNNYSPFEICFSPNNTKMAIVSVYEKPKQVTIYETNSNKKIGIKTLIQSYKNVDIASSHNYTLDDNGAFFYIFTYNKKTDCIANIQPEATQPLVTDLVYENIQKNHALELVNNNTIAYVGVFRDDVPFEKPFTYKGITYLQTDYDVKVKGGIFSYFIDTKTNELKNKNANHFSDDVEKKLSYEIGLIKGRTGLKYYSYEKTVVLNGCVYVIESHSYTFEFSNKTKYSVSTSVERELIITKYTEDGKMDWMKIIPKCTMDKLNNFNLVIRNNKLNFFYAENPKNLKKGTVDNYDPEKYAEISNYNGSVLVCTTIDEKGNLNRTEVLKNQGWCYDPDPMNILLDNNNTLIIRMINKDLERYDKFILK
jgi:hypothetical protein